MKTKLKFYSLSNMLASNEYQTYESETLLNIQYHIINTRKDVDEMIAHNEIGMFGCSHGEFIECWRDFIKDHKLSMVSRGILEYEIDRCEKFHEEAGTLNLII